MTGWDGLLLIDKPVGPTSHDIVARARRICGTRRVGHAGTLDPPASGLLPLVLGRATRLVRFLPQSPKCYEGQFELGRTTSTDDATGETLTVAKWPLPDRAAVKAIALGLMGPIEQMPPRVSARKVGGQRMYALARKGIEVTATPRAVEILRFDIEAIEPNETAGRAGAPARYRFETDVTSGTYVRSLVRDLGAALGCGGTLLSLRRTAIGPIDVRAALALPRDAPDPSVERVRRALIPLDRMSLEPPNADLPDVAAARQFTQGRSLATRADWPEGLVCARSPGGALLGIGEIAAGTLRPRVVVPPE